MRPWGAASTAPQAAGVRYEATEPGVKSALLSANISGRAVHPLDQKPRSSRPKDQHQISVELRRRISLQGNRSCPMYQPNQAKGPSCPDHVGRAAVLCELASPTVSAGSRATTASELVPRTKTQGRDRSRVCARAARCGRGARHATATWQELKSRRVATRWVARTPESVVEAEESHRATNF